jgi:hypothetical protein
MPTVVEIGDVLKSVTLLTPSQVAQTLGPGWFRFRPRGWLRLRECRRARCRQVITVQLLTRSPVFWLLPFIEAVGDEEVALALLPRMTKCGCGIARLCPCIDRGETSLEVGSPTSQPRRQCLPSSRKRPGAQILRPHACRGSERAVSPGYLAGKQTTGSALRHIQSGSL